jgi:hypothetical protein
MTTTTTLTDVSARLGGEITPNLLDQLQFLQAVTDGTGSAAYRRGAIQGVAELKTVTDTLYTLDYELRGEPVEPGEALIFADGRR